MLTAELHHLFYCVYDTLNLRINDDLNTIHEFSFGKASQEHHLAKLHLLHRLHVLATTKVNQPGGMTSLP